MQDLTPILPTHPESRSLRFGLVLSLAIHAMLLSLAFGGQGLGRAGSSVAWQNSRTEVSDLRVVLLPQPVPAAEPLLSTDIEQALQPNTAEPTTKTLAQVVPSTQISAAASHSTFQISPLQSERPNEKTAPLAQPAEDLIALTKPDKSTWAVPPAPEVSVSVSVPMPVPVPVPVPVPASVAAIPPLPDAADARQDAQRQAELLKTDRQETAKQAAAQKNAERQEAARAETLRIEAERKEVEKQLAETLTAARQEASRQEVTRADAARVDAERQEATKKAATRQLAALQEAARAEAERKEVSRQETAKQVAAQQEATRQEAARAEAARVEAERHEVAKQTAAKQIAEKQIAENQAAARQEAARQEVARADAVRIDAERQKIAKILAAQQLAAIQEVARTATAQAQAQAQAERQEISRQETGRQAAAQQEAARQEAARQAAIQIEVTRLAALQAEAEKRQEKLRAIGRQLNEEAALREAAAQRQLPSASSARRGRLFGRTDANSELVLYAEAWSRKIQLNMTFDMVRDAAKQPHADPMVTVAIRSDGSVESISFVTSSGVPAIDDAIRRIVHSQANYQAFPPGLTKDFDVIEIRRTWYFDMAIRLY